MRCIQLACDQVATLPIPATAEAVPFPFSHQARLGSSDFIKTGERTMAYQRNISLLMRSLRYSYHVSAYRLSSSTKPPSRCQTHPPQSLKWPLLTEHAEESGRTKTSHHRHISPQLQASIARGVVAANPDALQSRWSGAAYRRPRRHSVAEM